MKYLFFILMLITSPLWAKDILWMKNGDRLSGNIEEVSTESVRITLPYSQSVTIKRDSIKRWRLDKQDPPKVTAKGGINLFKAEQNTPNTWLWGGSGDLNIKLKHRDKNTNNVNFKGQTEVANLDWRYSLSGEYTYETSDNITNSHDYKLNPTLDYFFNEKWFVRSALNAEYDMLAVNYLQLDYGSGPGYRFWNEKRRRLELMAQGGVRKTYFRKESEIGVLFEGKRIIDYPFASLNWDYRQPFSFWKEKLELFSQGRYLRYLDQPSPYITRDLEVNASLGLRYYFNDHLRISWLSEMEWLGGADNYSGQPQTYKESEFRHLLSMGASF
ncbi:DUF481 domain-containing protein [Aeromonas australiensis]|uniref:DUF481 domain-containing protein n=1 Tax=Aeromonas australiensis TaxID=1114880 RepID=UPI001F323507|nr:DUF481 domain-containing protein [Aeromonas australiensis]MCF3097689.1 DUF481 domain-containing protein [Aeromonas australiensis]